MTRIEAARLAAARYLPPEHARLVRKALALLHSRQVQTELMRANKRELAKQRREALAAAAQRAIDHRAKTLVKMGWRDRASFVQERLAKFPAKYGLPADYTPTTKDIRVIRAVLREWEKQLAPS